MSYKDLKSYQNSTIIYDFTVEFCRLYIRFGSRTKDQMEQAARSGKQNIVEGSEASRISKKTEIKLIGVSRASFEELLEDYKDYLRQHSMRQWDKDSSEAKFVRSLVYKTDRTYETYRPYLQDPEKAANVMICLINQTNFLLNRQLDSLEEKFVTDGGYTENLFKKRLQKK